MPQIIIVKNITELFIEGIAHAKHYDHPQDVLRPIAVILELVMYITLDPEATELACSLIEYAHELADSHCLKRHDAEEVAHG